MSFERSYVFTSDWLSQHLSVWDALLAPLKGQPDLRGLEVGSYEGMSAIWFLENVLAHPTSRLTCIDSFQGGDLYRKLGLDLVSARQTFEQNMSRFGTKVELIVGDSGKVLRQSRFEEASLDFVYIDGSHAAKDVLEDAVLCWRLLKPSRLMIFDDYDWELGADNPLHRPKVAIDAFLEVMRDEVEKVHHGHQVIVRKRGTFA